MPTPMKPNSGGFVAGLRPTTRVPRDKRPSPIVNTMAKTGPDAKPRANTQPAAVDGGSANGTRTSAGRKGSTKIGGY
jgi:hypothetical protein